MQTKQQEPGAATTVLVVEDEALVRMMTVNLVEDMGYRVIEAASAEKALELVQGELRIDVLFTDIRMPGLDGFALAERVRALRPGVRVIYATGYADLERAPSPLAMGPLLRKPYAPEKLREEIQRAMTDEEG